MKFFLIRHGQSTGDLEGRYGGDYDDELSAAGVTQAQQLATTLSANGIRTVFSSPLRRAQGTAHVLASTLGCEMVVIPEFKECNRYGVISGMTEKEARSRFPGEMVKLSDRHQTILGGESYEDFSARVRGAVVDLLARQSDGKIALVTHGGVIRVVFREILQAGEISLGDCAFAELTVNEKKLSVAGLQGIKVTEPLGA